MNETELRERIEYLENYVQLQYRSIDEAEKDLELLSAHLVMYENEFIKSIIDNQKRLLKE